MALPRTDHAVTSPRPLRWLWVIAVLGAVALSAFWPAASSLKAAEVRLGQVINPMTCARDVTADGVTDSRSFSDNRCERYFTAAGMTEPSGAPALPAADGTQASPDPAPQKPSVAAATKALLGWLSP